MPKFALKYPFFILMVCLVVSLVGTVSLLTCRSICFPEVNMPVVVVATFYAGMPPQQIESDITNSYERFFTLGSNIDHIESRSLTGVSLIKIYFSPEPMATPRSATSPTLPWPTCAVCRRELCRRWC